MGDCTKKELEAYMKALVAGSGGFIGSHLVTKLKSLGYYVRGVDLKYPEFSKTDADEFIIGDLRSKKVVNKVMRIKGGFDECFALAADMGGAQYIFSGDNDADIMPNSHAININVAEAAVTYNIKKLFYSSSACIYPAYNQTDPDNPKCSEDSAYPVEPDSEYGYEKILSERLYSAYRRNYGLNVRIARFHNIFGERGTYEGNRAKAPAALCRKVALAKDGDYIEVLGDGKQTRSFLYIDECIFGVLRLMQSDYQEPLNIGSDEMISINDLTQMIINLSGKDLKIRNVPSNVTGVRGRNSDNTLIKQVLGWAPTWPLLAGMEKLYSWVNSQTVDNNEAIRTRWK